MVELSCGQFSDDDIEYDDDDVIPLTDEPITNKTTLRTTMTIYNRSSSYSPLIAALLMKHSTLKVLSNRISSISGPNQSTRSSKSITKSNNIKGPIPPYFLARKIINQINFYRHNDIVARIKQCDPRLKLNEICESYSFDNHTYAVRKSSIIDFQRFENIYDVLVVRSIVDQLIHLCSPGQWCLKNISDNDVQYTRNAIHQRGQSFCTLVQCDQRLSIYIDSCPSLLVSNISKPTLKLLPMLCALYHEYEWWNSTECTQRIVSLFHFIYAFWPQLERCYNVITSGFGGCEPECLTFDRIFHDIQDRCHPNATFLSRVPAIAWFRLINLNHICRGKSIVTGPPSIPSIKTVVSANVSWYKDHQRPVYAALFLLIFVTVVVSFSLCLYLMSRKQPNAISRHFNDDYEYTRLHDTSFELGNSTEIPNGSSSNGSINQTNSDRHGSHRSLEHQRLLNFGS